MLVKIPRLSLQFWTEDVFRCVDNDLWVFSDYEKSFLEFGNMVYAHILVHLDTREGLVETLKL